MTRAKRNPAAAAGTRAVAKPAKGGALASFDYGEDSGAGFEGQDASHLSIPFLALLQSNSPQVTAEDSTLKAGMLYNTVTEEAFKGSEGVEFIPACVDHVFVEWVPRSKGGGGGAGFVGVHQVDSEIVMAAKARPRLADQKRSVLLTEDGNELVETFYMYGVLVDSDGNQAGLAVLSFTSTKIKVYRNYSTKISLFNWKKAGMPARPPLFANRVRVTTVKQSNTQGDFYNLVLTPAVDGDVAKSMLPPDSPLLAAARDVWNMVRSGAAKAAHQTERSTSGVGSAEETTGDDEIPF